MTVTRNPSPCSGSRVRRGRPTSIVQRRLEPVVRAIAQSFVNVKQDSNERLNAVDGLFVSVVDGAMTNGSYILTSASGGFTANHVGQSIDVAGAGLAGATLKTYIDSYTNPNTLQLVTRLARASPEKP